jgi:hypothetical protein
MILSVRPLTLLLQLYTVLLALVFAASARAQPFTHYDLIVAKAANPSDVTIVDGAGIALPPDRSFVIGIEGVLRNPIEFRNWSGSAKHPIVITNRHGTGRVSISDLDPANPSAPHRNGIHLHNCQFIQLRGDNDPAHRYGIEIARAGGKHGGSGKRGVEVTGVSTDVEISFLEIREVSFAGIMIKEDPGCDPATSHPNLVYRNIRVHDNYIHDCGAEGLYIGFSFWSDDRCPDGEGGYAHNIEGLRIYNNLVERCLWDGIQVGGAPVDVEIFNNVIVDSGIGGGTGKSGDTGVGVQIGGGTTGLLYNNLILNSRSTGIAMFGIGNNIVFNNLIVGARTGIFLDNRPDPVRPGDLPERQTQPGAPYYVYHNTFIDIAGHAMWTMSAFTENHFKNNLVVAAPAEDRDFIRYDKPANRPDHPLPTGIEEGNTLQRDTAGLRFADPDHYDFRLLNSSTSGIDAGVPLPNYVRTDFQGLPRSQGEASRPDSGYTESATLSLFLIAKPPSPAADNGTITASAINGTAPYAYAWSNGATSKTITNLPPGLYHVTVTDAAGRTMTQATYLFAGATMGMPVSDTPPSPTR